jgi:hypothetical protein
MCLLKASFKATDLHPKGQPLFLRYDTGSNAVVLLCAEPHD